MGAQGPLIPFEWEGPVKYSEWSYIVKIYFTNKNDNLMPKYYFFAINFDQNSLSLVLF